MKTIMGYITLILVVLIVFVKSGQRGGISGGQQAANIIGATFGGITSSIRALAGD